MDTSEATITSWDGTQRWRPSAIHHPASEEELGAIVAQAAERGARVKPVGGALSWSDCADMPDQAVRFDRMAAVVEVDPGHLRVRVQGGAPLSTVNEALADHGLAFDNFGSIVMQTAAGYTGSGSHGTGGRTPILSSYLTSMRLVDGTGAVRTLSPEQEPELFSVARVHLGALGAVTELTFRCVRQFDLEERLVLMPWETLLADLDTLVETNDYVKIWWLAHTKEAQVYLFNRTDAPRTPRTLNEWIDTAGISSQAFTALMAMARGNPRIIPHMHRLVQRTQFRPHRRVDRSDRIIRYVGTIPQHQETEYAVERGRAARALDEVRQMVVRAHEARRYHVNFPLEVRFVAPDDIAMSPTRDRPSCYIGPYVGSVEWARGYFAEFEELMLDYQGRPHWGKTFHRTASQLEALYGEGFHRFAAARAKLDPHGVFSNAFTDRVFGTSPREGTTAQQVPR